MCRRRILNNPLNGLPAVRMELAEGMTGAVKPMSGPQLGSAGENNISNFEDKPLVPSNTAYNRPLTGYSTGMALTALLALGSQSAQAQTSDIEQAISLGGYYASGDYGADVDTDIVYLPLTYEVNAGAWGIQLAVPMLRVTGLGNVLVNVGGVTQAVAGADVMTSSGLGDVIASLIYRAPPWSETSPFIDLRLDVKLPTADEARGLGTGEVDVSAQIDLSQQIGALVGFATAGYTWRGTTTLFPGLQDAAFAQIGLAMPLSEALNVGAYYDFREAASAFSPESHEILPYMSWQFSDQWSFTGLLSTGFTDASADIGVLGQLRYSW